MDHAHKWDRLDLGPPKMFLCTEPGCKAKAAVDPETNGPGEVKAPAPAKEDKKQ